MVVTVMGMIVMVVVVMVVTVMNIRHNISLYCTLLSGLSYKLHTVCVPQLYTIYFIGSK